MRITLLLLLSLLLVACNSKPIFAQLTAVAATGELASPIGKKLEIDRPSKLDTMFCYHPQFIADSFDFPVGKPNAEGYYNAQGFRANNHLGEDWNGVSGGNSDLGDTIYSIANGLVTCSKDFFGGWGKVVRIVHELPDGDRYESLYAHCDDMLVEEGSFVKKGEPIGTIGTAHGRYLAHLHFELRDVVHIPLGGGYSYDVSGYIDPTEFIESNRAISYD